MVLFFGGGFSGFELEVLLFLDEFGDVAAQFLEGFLLLGGFFEIVNFIGELLLGFFEGVDCGLLGVGGILGLGEFVLGLLHLACSLADGFGGFGGDLGGVLLGVLCFAFYFFLFFGLLLQTFALLRIHFTGVLGFLLGLGEGLFGFFKFLLRLSEGWLGGGLGFFFCGLGLFGGFF